MYDTAALFPHIHAKEKAWKQGNIKIIEQSLVSTLLLGSNRDEPVTVNTVVLCMSRSAAK